MPVTQAIYDVVVGAAGNQTTLTAGEAALSASSTMYVKAETYSEGGTVTFSENNVEIYMEPGTVVDDAITLSGDGVYLHLGVGCDIQGTITVSGDGCSLICQNGVDLDAITVTGAGCRLDGGGLDTLLSSALTITSTDGMYTNFKIVNASGTAVSIGVGGARSNFINSSFTSTNTRAFFNNSGNSAVDILLIGCNILDATFDGISNSAPRARIIGNYSVSAGRWGIHFSGTADDSIVYGNVVEDATTATLILDTGASDIVAVGNRLDGAVSDSGTSNTIALNDETAF